VLALLTCAVLAPSYAMAKLARSGTPSVKFTALGSMGLKMVGTSSELEVTEDEQNISLVVGLSQLDTGISLRDRHMREKYLQVQQFPTATLVVPRSAVQLPAEGATSKGSAKATLKLHGHEHPVSVQYQVQRHGKNLEVEGSLHLQMTDFDVIVPTYLGITVKPDVDVVAKFVATDL
jgi:polyisoprenoid-binding protein YceI